MRWKFLLSITVVLLLIVTWSVTRLQGSNHSFDKAGIGIAMREIGHRLLLAAGDSTSRVLPVQQPAADEYLVGFERPLFFRADTLVEIVRRTLRNNGLPLRYLVQVLHCDNAEVTYGFSVGATKDTSLIPCVGREQPPGCYQVKIVFPPAPSPLSTYYPLLLALLLAGSLFFAARWYFQRKKKVAGASPDITGEPPVPIGAFLFYCDKRLLVHAQEQITLTAKEAKLLYLFSRMPNTVISRADLMKAVWEDEGVLVGRSLDMFVSKLRKKLQNDPAVRLVNEHGKGYKLVTGLQI